MEAGEEEGDGKGGKSDGNGDKEGDWEEDGYGEQRRENVMIPTLKAARPSSRHNKIFYCSREQFIPPVAW
jgi:hypothetical protein